MIAVIAIPALITAIGFFIAMLFRWRAGYIGLLVYLPFAGAVSLFFFPNPSAKLIKDVLFVIPLYLIVLLFVRFDLRASKVPGMFMAATGLLTVLVLVQMVNPGVSSTMVGLLGAKVWLLYIPLVFVTGMVLRSPKDLSQLMRILVFLIPVPCAVGLLIWSQSQATTVTETMTFYYGAAAKAASFQFAQFPFGGISLFRIPSTFTFVSQYFGFILAMIVPAYVVWQSDEDRRFRYFGGLMLVLLIVSGFLSGARAAFLLMPPMLILVAVLEGRLSRIVLSLPILVAFVGLGLTTIGVDYSELISDLAERTGTNGSGAKKPVVDDFIIAVSNHPWGLGTGMNTGAARQNLATGSSVLFLENYFAKAVIELGILGLVSVLALFLSVLASAVKLRQSIAHRQTQTFSAACAAFVIIMMISSLHGFHMDQDPVNVLFWVYAGILFRAPVLLRENGHIAPVSHCSRSALSGRRLSA